MQLVIAEKPSVAQSIAAVLGATKKESGYLIGAGYIVSWCVGHLVELSAPETYDDRYSKWRLEDLPILPESWLYQVSSGTKKQFGILKELVKRPDHQQSAGRAACSEAREYLAIRENIASLYDAERKENANRKKRKEQER